MDNPAGLQIRHCPRLGRIGRRNCIYHRICRHRKQDIEILKKTYDYGHARSNIYHRQHHRPGNPCLALYQIGKEVAAKPLMPSPCPIISRYKKSHSPHTFPLSALQGNKKIWIFVLRDAIFVNGKREFMRSCIFHPQMTRMTRIFKGAPPTPTCHSERSEESPVHTGRCFTNVQHDRRKNCVICVICG